MIICIKNIKIKKNLQEENVVVWNYATIYTLFYKRIENIYRLIC
jgi:hypothetical protein